MTFLASPAGRRARLLVIRRKIRKLRDELEGPGYDPKTGTLIAGRMLFGVRLKKKHVRRFRHWRNFLRYVEECDMRGIKAK